MVNLQKLQNLVSIQHSPLPSLASLQGLSGLSSTAGLNSPLNLSVGSASNLNTSQHSTGGALGGSQLPQLILASGQLIQGVQGAQLLIPTSQGKYNFEYNFCRAELVYLNKRKKKTFEISKLRYNYNAQ